MSLQLLSNIVGAFIYQSAPAYGSCAAGGYCDKCCDVQRFLKVLSENSDTLPASSLDTECQGDKSIHRKLPQLLLQRQRPSKKTTGGGAVSVHQHLTGPLHPKHTMICFSVKLCCLWRSNQFLIPLHIQQQTLHTVTDGMLTSTPCCESWQLSATICGPIVTQSQLMIARILHSTRFLGRLLEKKGRLLS